MSLRHAAELDGTTELTLRLDRGSNGCMARALLLVDALFIVLYLLPNLLGHGTRMFDLDAESNLPTWYASMKLFVIAQVMVALAVVLSRRSLLDAIPFLFLGAVALLLSADEVATIHERFARHFESGLTGAHRSDLLFSKTGYWMLALAPLLAAALAAGIWLIRSRLAIPGRIAVKGLVGVAVYFLSATGLEMLSNFATGTANLLQVAAEEGGEMMGATIVLWALLDLLAAKLEPARRSAPVAVRDGWTVTA